MNNKLDMTQEELLELLNKAKEKIYSQTISFETPDYYVIQSSIFNYIVMKNRLSDLTHQLLKMDIKQLCVTSNPIKLYNIKSDGTLELAKFIK